MKVTHILKSGEKVATVKGHRLTKEKTEQILKLMAEVNKNEKKNN